MCWDPESNWKNQKGQRIEIKTKRQRTQRKSNTLKKWKLPTKWKHRTLRTSRLLSPSTADCSIYVLTPKQSQLHWWCAHQFSALRIELKQRARTLSPTFGGAIIQNFNFVKNHEFKFSLWYSYVVSLVLQFDMG